MADILKSTIPAADITAIGKDLDDAISLIEPHFVNLDNHSKQGIRTMSTNREGLARLVDGIANANIDSLSRNIDPTKLSDKLAYRGSLNPILQKLNKIMEMMSEINMANGADIMQLSDIMTNNLQSARTNSSALDLAMKPVDEWNKRFAHNPDADTPTGGDSGHDVANG